MRSSANPSVNRAGVWLRALGASLPVPRDVTVMQQRESRSGGGYLLVSADAEQRWGRDAE